MGLYYLKEIDHCKSNSTVNCLTNDQTSPELSELYKSSQMFNKNLEDKIKLKNEEIRKMATSSAEISRHNEAMMEEINILNNKIDMYPKTIQELKSEVDKLSHKITLLEEQKKFMEQQATQNEAKLQQSQGIQQDLIHTQAYVERLKKYIDSSSAASEGYKNIDNLPPFCLDKSTQASSAALSSEKVQQLIKDQFSGIKTLRSDLVFLRRQFSEINQIEGSLSSLRELLGEVTCSCKATDHVTPHNDPTPIQFLFTVERVEVTARVLPPASEQATLSTHTNNTNNTSVIVQDNTTSVSTFNVDLVIPITSSKQQISRMMSRTAGYLAEDRSVLLVMLGDASHTLYGTPQNHGLIHHLLKMMLGLKKENHILTISIGTFVKNQMCDGLSEFSKGDGKVTAVPVSNLDQGTELLSEADIPDQVEQVLHQFTFRDEADTSCGNVSVLECDTMDLETLELLKNYRGCGAVVSGSKPNVVYDTIQAFIEKGGALCVFVNLKPEISSTAENLRLLRYTSHITGVEPVVQNKKKGLFSFRN